MNGVVFHTSVAMMTNSDAPRSVSHARSVLNHSSMKPIPGVNANCHADRGDDRDHPVGDEDRRPHEPPPDERAVEDHRDRHPEHELDGHRDHGERERGPEVGPPQVGRQHVDVVLAARRTRSRPGSAGRRAAARGRPRTRSGTPVTANITITAGAHRSSPSRSLRTATRACARGRSPEGVACWAGGSATVGLGDRRRFGDGGHSSPRELTASSTRSRSASDVALRVDRRPVGAACAAPPARCRCRPGSPVACFPP